MKTKKTLSTHQVFCILYALAALLTMLPRAMASKACRLGYHALCSWTPYSTAILLALLVLHIILARHEARQVR